MFYSNVILNLHSINDEKWFEKMLLGLMKHYKFVSLNDICDHLIRQKSLSRACHITFDDGDNSFYNLALPILKKYDIPSTVFVSPDVIKSRKNFWFQEISDYSDEKIKDILKYSIKPEIVEKYPLNTLLKSMKIEDIWKLINIYQEKFNKLPKDCLNMGIEQVEELNRTEIVSIGAHTMRHPILKNENDKTANYEISESVKQLEKILENKVISFAYPNGKPEVDFSQREIDILKKQSIEIAFSTERKRLRAKSNFLNVPRIGITSGSDLNILTKILLEDKWDIVRKIVKGKQEFENRIVLN